MAKASGPVSPARADPVTAMGSGVTHRGDPLKTPVGCLGGPFSPHSAPPEYWPVGFRLAAASRPTVQTPDPEKRRLILATAARLFAEQPFHEVTLDQVAADARVGKGTLYVYFESKDHLYAAAVAEGLSELADTIDGRLRTAPTGAGFRLAAIVEELLGFSRRYPHVFALMRSGHPIAASGELSEARRAVAARIETVLRDGVARGELDDPRPDLTAQFVLAMVRASLLYGPVDAPHADLAAHILRVLHRGVAVAPS